MGTPRAARTPRSAPGGVLACLLAFVLACLAPGVALAEGPLEGNWLLLKSDKSLDPSTMVTIKVDKRTVNLSSLGTIHYTARADGPDVPIQGDLNITSVSIRMPSRNVLVEVAKGGGKPFQTTQYEAAADGRTMQVTWKNHKSGTSGSYTLGKQ